jgi:protein-L-isoaspartate(D-aspartate) O-methyltransferase
MQPFHLHRSGELHDLAMQRARMVDEQLRARGIRDERVLTAFAKVPRERFVADQFRDKAYSDGPLPIGDGQTISQPLMVAIMVELLEVKPTDRVLEIGTGTGCEAAILGELAGEVWTIERHPELASRAREILQSLGYQNVCVVTGDGSVGLKERAPFDKIVVAAAAPAVPPSLIVQLGAAGTMVVPVGNRVEQQVTVLQKSGEDIVTKAHSLCSFVPLLGAEGWSR